MNQQTNTVDSLLGYISLVAENKGVIDPNTYLAVAEKLNALLQGEQEILFLKEQVLAKARKEYIEQGKTASYAKMMIEAMDEYLETRKQKAKIDRALETIRLSKIHAKLSNDIYKSQ